MSLHQHDEGVGQCADRSFRWEHLTILNQSRHELPQIRELRNLACLASCLVVLVNRCRCILENRRTGRLCQPSPLCHPFRNTQGVDEGTPDIRPKTGCRGIGPRYAVEGRRDHIQHGGTVEVIQRERSQAQEGFDQWFTRQRLPRRCREWHQMMLEYRLQPGLVGLQRAGHHTDLVKTITVHLDQGQDLTTDRR